MSQRRLEVLINGQVVGTLEDKDNLWGFQYAESWLWMPKAFALSPALPLTPEFQLDGATSRPVQWFFDNLLPEERLRDVIGKEEGLPESDAFGLLERLGSESAGALVLQPEGAPEAPKGTVTLTREALSARIRNLPRASLNQQAPKRMSLAGAQHKMVVNFDPQTGELEEPLKGTSSTHILKPNSTAEGYPHSVVNEVFTMRLAAALGLNVPKVWRLYVPEPVYIIERFDRSPLPQGQELLRVHALDGCQALNQMAYAKYKSATFDNLLRLIDLCRNKIAARLEVFRWIVFNTLVGNSDCHLKNISLLIDDEAIRVAPFYDLLCTAVYHTKALANEQAVWPDERLAMPVAEANFFGGVTKRKLIATGAALKLADKTAERLIDGMASKMAQEADAVMLQMDTEHTSWPLMGEAPPATRGAEKHLLRSIRHVVMKDMLTLVA